MGEVKIGGDLSGRVFGTWTALAFVENRIQPKGQSDSYWLCACICGTRRVVKGGSLIYGTSKSCGCFHGDRGKRKRKPVYQRILEATFNRSKSAARQRGLQWTLTLAEFEEVSKHSCFYCGAINTKPYKRIKGPIIYLFNGLDRVDNTKGYEHNNVVSCCSTCNVCKMAMTQEDLFRHIERMYLWLKEKNRI